MGVLKTAKIFFTSQVKCDRCGELIIDERYGTPRYGDHGRLADYGGSVGFFKTLYYGAKKENLCEQCRRIDSATKNIKTQLNQAFEAEEAKHAEQIALEKENLRLQNELLKKQLQNQNTGINNNDEIPPEEEEEYAVYCVNNGIEYYEKGNYEEAITSFNEALKYIRDDAEIWFHLSLAYSEMENFKMVVKCLDEAIKLNPDEAHFYYGRAGSYASLGNINRAFEDAKKAVHLDPDEQMYKELLNKISNDPNLNKNEVNNKSLKYPAVKKAARFCSACGNALKPNAKFCAGCGKQIG